MKRTLCNPSLSFKGVKLPKLLSEIRGFVVGFVVCFLWGGGRFCVFFFFFFFWFFFLFWFFFFFFFWVCFFGFSTAGKELLHQRNTWVSTKLAFPSVTRRRRLSFLILGAAKALLAFRETPFAGFPLIDLLFFFRGPETCRDEFFLRFKYFHQIVGVMPHPCRCREKSSPLTTQFPPPQPELSFPAPPRSQTPFLVLMLLRFFSFRAGVHFLFFDNLF